MWNSPVVSIDYGNIKHQIGTNTNSLVAENHLCSDGESTRKDGESSDCKITAGNRPGGELTRNLQFLL